MSRGFKCLSCSYLAANITPFICILCFALNSLVNCQLRTDLTSSNNAVSKSRAKGWPQSTIQAAKAQSDRHFESHGAKWPSSQFTSAVSEAAWSYTHTAVLSTSQQAHGSTHSVVLMAMTNDLAMQSTVPLFLQSLRSIRLPDSPNPHQSLVDILAMICFSHFTETSCREHGLSSRCVLDKDVQLGNHSLPSQSVGFRMIGFAKVKYILNTIALGHDVIFMDTDVVAFKDFLPYILGLGSDIAAMVEKCMVIDDKASYTGHNLPALYRPQPACCKCMVIDDKASYTGHNLPALNIGITYFRSSPGVTRCVHSWLYDMWREVVTRPLIWDQDVFRKVMQVCTKNFGVRLQAFSPRSLNSYCFKYCGCLYSEEDVLIKMGEDLRPIHHFSTNKSCPASVVQSWLLMHFPCGGETLHKARLMQQYYQMHSNIQH
ncbi:hypothetical protein CEUSTIGMA_g1170.t1 [Chlamydomonas eustigma]|uniref:Glycosyltransferase n=1 Tax=Chlamydomonas eustigma TaxID=1157962 RepID=A0A250WS96_9CHLO|nr:hypothetical protein CEUSTIGMA_g1170.t1 [Chlamydomonas eustigma]|eukprot:GAX73717.1 hypothetical protein CEUSTIGMA_g1170.t1 [Chlamydomonas eustigma]